MPYGCPMDVHDGKWLAETLRVLQQPDAWAARTGADGPGLRPAPRSPLCGDDNQAHPYQLSHAAWHFLSGAVDHLGCLRTLLCEAKVVHMCPVHAHPCGAGERMRGCLVASAG